MSYREREPDFEDEKIRFWLHPLEGKQADEFKGEPTVLSIDSETEEIFESRTYRLRVTIDDAPLAFRLALAEKALSQPEADLEKLVEDATAFLADASFKFLAKRRKDEDIVTYILLFQSQGVRQLLLRNDRVAVESYRKMVAEFEQDFLGRGLVFEPLVVDVEEWRSYIHNLKPPERTES